MAIAVAMVFTITVITGRAIMCGPIPKRPIRNQSGAGGVDLPKMRQHRSAAGSHLKTDRSTISGRYGRTAGADRFDV